MNALLTLLIWAWLMASSFVVSGHMTDYASPIATSGFRFLLALILVFLLLAWQWHRAGLKVSDQLAALFRSRQRLGHYFIISGALVGFFIGLFVALQSTTPLNTSVLYTLLPLMGVIMSRFLLREAMPRLKVAGFILGSLAAMMVLFSSQASSSNGFMHFEWHKGDGIFLGACALLALHVVSVQKWGRTLAPLSGAFMIMFFGVIWLLPITLIWGQLNEVKWLATGFWNNVLYLTVFTTLFTFVLQQRLVMTVGASRLLAFSYTIPVWVAGYTALSQGQLTKLLSIGFLSGLLCLWAALLLIEGKHIGRRIMIEETHSGSNAATK